MLFFEIFVLIISVFQIPFYKLSTLSVLLNREYELFLTQTTKDYGPLIIDTDVVKIACFQCTITGVNMHMSSA